MDPSVAEIVTGRAGRRANGDGRENGLTQRKRNGGCSPDGGSTAFGRRRGSRRAVKWQALCLRVSAVCLDCESCRPQSEAESRAGTMVEAEKNPAAMKRAS